MPNDMAKARAARKPGKPKGRPAAIVIEQRKAVAGSLALQEAPIEYIMEQTGLCRSMAQKYAREAVRDVGIKDHEALVEERQLRVAELDAMKGRHLRRAVRLDKGEDYEAATRCEAEARKCAERIHELEGLIAPPQVNVAQAVTVKVVYEQDRQVTAPVVESRALMVIPDVRGAG